MQAFDLGGAEAELLKDLLIVLAERRLGDAMELEARKSRSAWL